MHAFYLSFLSFTHFFSVFVSDSNFNVRFYSILVPINRYILRYSIRPYHFVYNPLFNEGLMGEMDEYDWFECHLRRYFFILQLRLQITSYMYIVLFFADIVIDRYKLSNSFSNTVVYGGFLLCKLTARKIGARTT